MHRWIALATLSACGGGGSVTPDAPLDGDTIDAAEHDARLPTCAGGTFTSSIPVPILNTGADETFLRLSQDELTAYFVRAESVATVYTATRSDVMSPFPTAIALPITGNGGNDVASPTVTADGLTMYFVSSRTGTLGANDVWMATRPNTAADFGSLAHLSGLSSAADEMDVFVVPDGSALYISSARTAGVYSIWRAQKNGTDFDAPIEVLSESPSYINRVVVSSDERTMLYQIGNDLRLSTRATASTAWQPGIALDMLNSVNADNPTWLSPDLCRLYFQTNRTGSQGMDFHLAERMAQ